MYTLAIHCQQVMSATVLSVSLSETSDDGSTYTVATATSSSDLLASADEDPYWIFLQQVSACLSSALGDQMRPFRTTDFHDRMDGGWGGAGESGQPRTK